MQRRFEAKAVHESRHGLPTRCARWCQLHPVAWFTPATAHPPSSDVQTKRHRVSQVTARGPASPAQKHPLSPQAHRQAPVGGIATAPPPNMRYRLAPRFAGVTDQTPTPALPKGPLLRMNTPIVIDGRPPTCRAKRRYQCPASGTSLAQANQFAFDHFQHRAFTTFKIRTLVTETAKRT